ncbi:class I SAM-dependent methyltransferase [Zeaxanthinibacter sp. PT1]|uniref:class I SAM-dependent methyltransferase n=1 Tax=Zeaxanthinibacter TaxID=561554 RepID=UPI00234A9075|nr:class I SAM-dependent methyltransferase [Zeaxanthinibacter sp. PT1]MDC6351327.1 class I SAM-dependent methyltransferase [Zeaxanthinibacter sp. PT1]
MTTTDLFDAHVAQYEKWYEDHQEVFQSELLALREQFAKLPENIQGIEIGLGTGRFSQPLGIKEGIEPSKEMAKLARKRGIEIMGAMAERLPYADLQFDFVLFVTICFLKDLKKALQEARRVLKPKGALIMGFLDSDQAVAKAYEAKKKHSNFYRDARFYKVSRIASLLRETGFVDPEYSQTLFGKLEDIEQLQFPLPGHGEGSFVVVKAIRK